MASGDNREVPRPPVPAGDGMPSPGPPRRGNAVSVALVRLAERLTGWSRTGKLPIEGRFVVVVAPHTSNWDFLVAMFAMFAFGLRLSWLGKHSLFLPPFGWILRWLGGEPIDRGSADGIVGAAIDRFLRRPQFVLGVAPEGTRRRAGSWKTGFHRIALGAGVPIVPVWLDYRRRCIGMGQPIWPTADLAADLARLGAVFRREMALRPERFTEPSPGSAGGAGG